MKAHCVWNENLQFTSTVGVHSLVMDASKPLGGETAPNPKELLLTALCGCTAMDVVSLLRKYRQNLEEFSIEAEAESSDSHPTVFKAIHLLYKVKGAIEPQKVKEAVQLSQTRYCSVSAMISGVVPVSYTIELNDSVLTRGDAEFAKLLSVPTSGAA
jgi:putative redox protein